MKFQVLLVVSLALCVRMALSAPRPVKSTKKSFLSDAMEYLEKSSKHLSTNHHLSRRKQDHEDDPENMEDEGADDSSTPVGLLMEDGHKVQEEEEEEDGKAVDHNDFENQVENSDLYDIEYDKNENEDEGKSKDEEKEIEKAIENFEFQGVLDEIEKSGEQPQKDKMTGGQGHHQDKNRNNKNSVQQVSKVDNRAHKIFDSTTTADGISKLSKQAENLGMLRGLLIVDLKKLMKMTKELEESDGDSGSQSGGQGDDKIHNRDVKSLARLMETANKLIGDLNSTVADTARISSDNIIKELTAHEPAKPADDENGSQSEAGTADSSQRDHGSEGIENRSNEGRKEAIEADTGDKDEIQPDESDSNENDFKLEKVKSMQAFRQAVKKVAATLRRKGIKNKIKGSGQKTAGSVLARQVLDKIKKPKEQTGDRDEKTDINKKDTDSRNRDERRRTAKEDPDRASMDPDEEKTDTDRPKKSVSKNTIDEMLPKDSPAPHLERVGRPLLNKEFLNARKAFSAAKKLVASAKARVRLYSAEKVFLEKISSLLKSRQAIDKKSKSASKDVNTKDHSGTPLFQPKGHLEDNAQKLVSDRPKIGTPIAKPMAKTMDKKPKVNNLNDRLKTNPTAVKLKPETVADKPKTIKANDIVEIKKPKTQSEETSEEFSQAEDEAEHMEELVAKEQEKLYSQLQKGEDMEEHKYLKGYGYPISYPHLMRYPASRYYNSDPDPYQYDYMGAKKSRLMTVDNLSNETEGMRVRYKAAEPQMYSKKNKVQGARTKDEDDDINSKNTYI